MSPVNGRFHREDGPAKEFVGGTKEWWVDGELHRLDGPAIDSESEIGSIYRCKVWYYKGKKDKLFFSRRI